MGIFDRSLLLLTPPTKKDGKATLQGAIDLSSYNTGNEARDRRVQRLIFEVEKEGLSTAELTGQMRDWKKGNFSTLTEVTLNFKGREEGLLFPSKVRQRRNDVKLTSNHETRMTFASTSILENIYKLMERCNHQSIASFADISFDVTFKKACP
jgi:hypothetical protein